MKTKTNFNIVKPNFLNQVFKTIKTFDGDSVKQNKPNSQFTIVFYWAKWMGDFNKTKLLALEKRINSIQDIDIRLIKVNADIQKPWGFSEDKLTQMFDKKSE